MKMKIRENRRRTRNLIRVANRQANALRWSAGETDDHILMKFQICKQLKKWGHEFYTEAIFESTGLRADIIDADEMLIYEIVGTEGEASMLKKQKDYPLEVRFVRADEAFRQELLL